jgi:hypothetical protein
LFDRRFLFLRARAFVAALVSYALLQELVKARSLCGRQNLAELQFGSLQLVAKVGRDRFHEPFRALLALAKDLFDPLPLFPGQVQFPLRPSQELETVTAWN